MKFFGKFRGWQKNEIFEKSGVPKKMESFFESLGLVIISKFFESFLPKK
jgi:hypothetical protein